LQFSRVNSDPDETDGLLGVIEIIGLRPLRKPHQISVRLSLSVIGVHSWPALGTSFRVTGEFWKVGTSFLEEPRGLLKRFSQLVSNFIKAS
jgi:hypothetical protein